MTRSERAPVIEAVRLGFPSDPWYVRVTLADGRVTYPDAGWRSEWAAERSAYYMRGAQYRDMAKRGEIGNGEECPLFPEHGVMFVLNDAGKPPVNYCPHVAHDGRRDLPRSRNTWPVHGFRESVAAYTARLDRAIREDGLPDLTDLEVK